MRPSGERKAKTKNVERRAKNSRFALGLDRFANFAMKIEVFVACSCRPARQATQATRHRRQPARFTAGPVDPPELSAAGAGCGDTASAAGGRGASMKI